MGWYVHLNVCFSCSENEPMAKVAQKHLTDWTEKQKDEHREAVWFLDELTKRVGFNPGPKGGLSMWGIIGNYTNVEEFCEFLRPFWNEILNDEIADVCRHEHILVFEEAEQSEQAIAYEIYLDDNGSLIIDRHKCPFSWRQF